MSTSSTNCPSSTSHNLCKITRRQRTYHRLSHNRKSRCRRSKLRGSSGLPITAYFPHLKILPRVRNQIRNASSLTSIPGSKIRSPTFAQYMPFSVQQILYHSGSASAIAFAHGRHRLLGSRFHGPGEQTRLRGLYLCFHHRPSLIGF
jgi:hypothetical protein